MTEPVCDLILLSWNNLPETRACLETLFTATRVPVRLFIVDNGSEPEVRSFLARVQPRGAVREVSVLQNDTNEGFPKGMNRGIRASSAPAVCLLNNDLRVTAGWLQEMLEVARADAGIGVVNPESDNFGNHPPNGQSIDTYAATLRARRGQYTEVGICIGFCMLVKREVIERIGGLSEEIERGFFEDEDFCIRAQQAGYRCVVAAASYVSHTGNRSFDKVPEREAIFNRNRRWCDEKWGRSIRVAWPRFEPVRPGSDELRAWLERLLIWARRRAYIYVYCPTPADMDPGALFRSVGLVPHADILWYPLPPRLGRWAATGRILKRRKKRFNIIVAPDPRWGQAMSRWRWLHRAAVVSEQNEEQLRQRWQLTSHSR